MDYKDVLKALKMDNPHRYEKCTIQKIGHYVESFFEFNNKSIADISQIDFENWIVSLRLNNYKQSTIRSILIQLNTFFNYCVDIEIIDRKPDTPYIRPVNRKIEYKLNEMDWLRIKEATINNIGHRAIFETLMSTGARSTELCRSKREDLDLDNQNLLLFGKRKKQRYVFLTEECCHWLNLYQTSRIDNNELLFLTDTDKYYTNTDLWRLIKHYVKELGLCSEINVRTFRYSFASNLYEGGMDIEYIAYLLGHVNVEVTKGYIFADE